MTPRHQPHRTLAHHLRLTSSAAVVSLVAFALLPTSITDAAPDGDGAPSSDEAPSDPTVGIDPGRSGISPSSGVSWLLSDVSAELTGTDSTQRLDFTIPTGWVADGPATFQMGWSTGPLSSGTLTVEVNNEHVTDVAFGPGEAGAAVEIPADLLVVGDNRLEVIGNIDVEFDDRCEDPNHPARRMTFAESTGLVASLAPTAAPLVDDAVAALHPLGNVDVGLDVHLVGDDPARLMTAAAHLAGSVREISADGVDVDVHLATDDLTLDPQRPSIVLGLAADIEQFSTLDDLIFAGPEGALTIDDLDIDDLTAAVPSVAAIAHRSTGSPVLVVAGLDHDAVVDAASSLTDDTPDDYTIDTAGDSLTLAELGYSERTLTGFGRDSTVYGLDVPIAGVPDSVTISVDARASTGIDDLRGVGVIVNGERIGTAAFAADGTTGDSAVVVPGSTLRAGRNVIRLDADFDLPTSNCGNGSALPSVEISDTTRIDIGPARSEISVDLDDLPYTFRTPVDGRDLAVVLPTDPAEAELADAIDVAVLLAPLTAPAEIIASDADADADRHLILLGSPDRQPMIESLDLEAAEPDADPATGIVVLAAHPTAPSRLVLAATGSDDDGAAHSAHALLDLGLRSDMAGAVSFVTPLRDSAGEDVTPVDFELTVEPTSTPLRLAVTRRPAGTSDDTGSNDAGSDGSSLDTAADATVVPLESTTAADEADDDDRSSPLGLAGGGVGVAAIAAVGVTAMRRRRSEPTGPND